MMEEVEIAYRLSRMVRDGIYSLDELEIPKSLDIPLDESMQLPEVDRQAWAATDAWKLKYFKLRRRMPRWGLVMKRFEREKAGIEGRKSKRASFSKYKA